MNPFFSFNVSPAYFWLFFFLRFDNHLTCYRLIEEWWCWQMSEGAVFFSRNYSCFLSLFLISAKQRRSLFEGLLPPPLLLLLTLPLLLLHPDLLLKLAGFPNGGNLQKNKRAQKLNLCPKKSSRQGLFFKFLFEGATVLVLRLDCSTAAALTTPQKLLSIWNLVKLIMHGFTDRTSTDWKSQSVCIPAISAKLPGSSY